MEQVTMDEIISFTVNGKLYVKVDFLYKGSFGRVYKCKDDSQKSVNVEVRQVVTSEKRKKLSEAEQKAKMDLLISITKQEYANLGFCTHPNVVRRVDYGYGAQMAILVTEHEVTTLDLFAVPGFFTPRKMVDWFLPLFDALEHVHVKGFMHLNVAPQHIVIFKGNADATVCKLGRFALAHDIKKQRKGPLGVPEYASVRNQERASFLEAEDDFISLGYCLLSSVIILPWLGDKSLEVLEKKKSFESGIDDSSMFGNPLAYTTSMYIRSRQASLIPKYLDGIQKGMVTGSL